MALKIIKGSSLPIGVDLGSSTIKVVQLRHADNGLELLAAGSLTVPRAYREDFTQRMQFASQSVRNIVKTKPFKSRQCVLSLPADTTVVQHVKVPKLPPEEIPKALQWELRGKLPYPVDQAIIRHLVAGDVFGDGEAKQEVIVVAAAKSTVEAVLAMARRAKLDVVGINVEPCAIVECFGRLVPRSSDTGRTILYVDMGATSTQVVLSQGNRIVFARNLTLGGEDLDQALAEGLSIPLEQAHSMRRDLVSDKNAIEAEDELVGLLSASLDDLAQKLTQCLRYYESVFRKQCVERVIFLGGQAYDKRLCQAIAQRLNLPAQIGDPLVRVQQAGGGGPCSAEPRPDWAVAVGLSLGAGCAA